MAFPGWRFFCSIGPDKKNMMCDWFSPWPPLWMHVPLESLLSRRIKVCFIRFHSLQTCVVFRKCFIPLILEQDWKPLALSLLALTRISPAGRLSGPIIQIPGFFGLALSLYCEVTHVAIVFSEMFHDFDGQSFD
jgi:hypothetical protein